MVLIACVVSLADVSQMHGTRISHLPRALIDAQQELRDVQADSQDSQGVTVAQTDLLEAAPAVGKELLYVRTKQGAYDWYKQLLLKKLQM